MREQELKKHQAEFIQEITEQDPEWVKGRRIEYLNHRKAEIFAEAGRWFMLIWKFGLAGYYDKHEIKDIEKINREIKRYNKPAFNSDKITQDLIDRAKEYPIGNLIEIDSRGFAVCPFHNEKTPSFYTKGNFYHCFGCGESGDVITLYQKLYNCDFITAVKKLI